MNKNTFITYIYLQNTLSYYFFLKKNRKYLAKLIFCFTFDKKMMISVKYIQQYSKYITNLQTMFFKICSNNKNLYNH